MDIKNIISKYKKKIKNLIEDIEGIYIEKGIQPFQKPFLYALLTVFISYLIYLSNKGTLKNNQIEYEKMYQLSLFANEYIDLKNNIQSYFKKIPSIKDKTEWLNYLLNTTAQRYQIDFTNVESQKELKVGNNIYVVSKQVQFTTDYQTLGKFITDLENSPVFVEISQLIAIKKDDNYIVNIEVTLNVSTIFLDKIV